jgi:SpoIID/LytB domain protein
MAFRGGARTVVCMLAASTFAASAPAVALTDEPEPVVISGVGAAHGFGMAMDGVEGQARAGWSHDRILDLFYPGTTAGRAEGTIRVGLANGPTATLGLPNGGVLSDAPKTGKPTVRIKVAPGTKIGLRHAGGKVVVTSGLPQTKRTPSEKANAAKKQAPPPELLPTPPPAPPVLEPTPTPKKNEPGAPAGPTASIEGLLERSNVWIWGEGDPALVSVAATGRRYRGQMEVKPGPGPEMDGLVVVNHVPLDTYVAGIAEEKGQAWPPAGMRVLAIAARSLGAATMTWYHKNTANGYDICATENCQVYLGYDGEESIMSRAVAETAGQIRTYAGRPILAMYHGNGGGQTESYAKVIDNGTDPYPYLRSVKYPFASPSRWTAEWTLPKIEASLREAGVAVPANIERIEISQRGESPRVVRLRIEGSDGTDDVSGVTFANALDLRSTWFDIGKGVETTGYASAALFESDLGGDTVMVAMGEPPWAAVPVTLAAFALLACAIWMRRREEQKETA